MSWIRITRMLLVVGLLALLSPGVRAQGLEEAASVPCLEVGQGGPGEKVQQIEDRFSPRLQQLKIQIQSARLQLAQLLTAPSPDRARVKAAMDKMLDLEREQQHLLLDKVFATLEVLKAEERSRYVNSIVDKLTR